MLNDSNAATTHPSQGGMLYLQMNSNNKLMDAKSQLASKWRISPTMDKVPPTSFILI